MPYLTSQFGSVEIEDYVSSRIIRVKYNGKVFKFFGQSEGEDGMIIYIGHGELDFRVVAALKAWCAKNKVGYVRWGDGPEANQTINILKKAS
ncbi:hypothetical protein A6F57_19865 [Alteromonas stellipolaris]|uniref:hypothetical protein n=1 Tax=Alteromonas stellipolaris TaxID=233316 RepID=UPI0007B42B87|nr:hypothetical protein [Alteromonas stellipolaris]ANB27238.1 hypothetical protein A6F57_19865 [Alteromonas stellipolaris]